MSKAVRAWAVQVDSALPQLMEMTDGGPLAVSWSAVVSASMKPCELLVVK